MKEMGSRRIKIIVTLLAVAAIVVALFLRPWPYTMDRTKYQLVPLQKPQGQSAESYAVNSSGIAVGRIEYSYEKVEIVKWYPDGTRQTLSLPEGVRAWPSAINDQGDIAGYFSMVNKPPKDSFVWSSARGFQPLHICQTFPFDWSISISMNGKGQVAGYMFKENPRKDSVYFYDPVEGLCDIGLLGLPNLSIGGINEDGMIAGSSGVSWGISHAFLWTKRDGIQDIHSAIDPLAKGTSALAISSDGWILVQAYYAKGRNRIILYHPLKGVGASSPFYNTIDPVQPVGRMDRFVFQEARYPWYAKFVRRQVQTSNWVWMLNEKPVLINPEVLSGQSWHICGMTDEGLIYGNIETDRSGEYIHDAFLLRPIRPAAPAEK